MTTTARPERRELAHRTSDGIEVTLFWTKATNSVTITVFDSRSEETLELAVDERDALDAFNHPYAYVANRRSRSRATTPVSPAGLTLGTDRES
ncbi:MAG: hypothetical protein ACJ780_30855 [Solirubrobacteraceae bacterium]